jgi:hypothetical protein
VPAADKKPDKGILEHNRKRQVEVKLLELQDELEAQGWAACDLRFVCSFWGRMLVESSFREWLCIACSCGMVLGQACNLLI